MNIVHMIGRVAKKSELKNINDTIILNITLAVEKGYKNADGTKECDFIPVVLFGKLAQNVFDHIDIGRLMCVSGRLQIRTYTKEETKKYFTEVVAKDIRFLDSKKKELAY